MFHQTICVVCCEWMLHFAPLHVNYFSPLTLNLSPVIIFLPYRHTRVDEWPRCFCAAFRCVTGFTPSWPLTLQCCCVTQESTCSLIWWLHLRGTTWVWCFPPNCPRQTGTSSRTSCPSWRTWESRWACTWIPCLLAGGQVDQDLFLCAVYSCLRMLSNVLLFKFSTFSGPNNKEPNVPGGKTMSLDVLATISDCFTLNFDLSSRTSVKWASSNRDTGNVVIWRSYVLFSCVSLQECFLTVAWWTFTKNNKQIILITMPGFMVTFFFILLKKKKKSKSFFDFHLLFRATEFHNFANRPPKSVQFTYFVFRHLC